jgi:hypothetical protein
MLSLYFSSRTIKKYKITIKKTFIAMKIIFAKKIFLKNIAQPEFEFVKRGMDNCIEFTLGEDWRIQ